ncbi:MAG TPA: urate oxidase [Candidatus Acidoferrales bacterium]|nr:urate oxidase [Candidatus Acidoferrales bacterium]
MVVKLGENSYGNSRVRLLRVLRREGRHDIKELTVAIRFEGDFELAHTKGENRRILPADTMRNTVYALARQYPVEAVEDFAQHLIEHFLTYNEQVSRVTVEASEHLWSRIPHGTKPHAFAFTRASGQEKRTAILNGTRDGTTIRAGIQDLDVLKTTKSAFEGFLRDPYTTLKEDRNRILATTIRAEWLYEDDEIEFSPTWHSVRQTLLETFAEHDSLSLQHTLYAMGEAVLATFDRIREIHLSFADKNFNLVDLSPFGMDNSAEVFLPTEEPQGLIEATLRKE